MGYCIINEDGYFDIITNGFEESSLLEIALKQAMSKLSTFQEHIIKMRYYEGKTQMQLAQMLGKRQSEIARAESLAIRQLRLILK
jgi:RNA polymerase sporulation-specific sigma factor